MMQVESLLGLLVIIIVIEGSEHVDFLGVQVYAILLQNITQL
jgi:hypothetical protein